MQVHNEILRTIARNCAAFGVREADVYREAGLPAESIAVADGRQDWLTGIRIWESALKLTNYRLISLSFGKNITFSVLGWLAPLTTSSPTLMRTWMGFAEFFPLMSTMMEYRVSEQPNESIKVWYKPSVTWLEVSPITAALATEHAMSLTLSLSGYLCGRIVKPTSTRFTHKVAVNHQPAFTDLFGHVRFDQPENSLEFDYATGQMPLISANPLMYDTMTKLCTEQLQQLQYQAGYVSKVLTALHSKQAYYTPKLEEVAAMLSMSERSLQRKLKEEGQTYQKLVETYQIETASQLLTQPGIQVQDVAFRLGFSNLQNFSRTFKRKTGYSPTAIKGRRTVV